jgi:hypothetical protein
MRRWVSVEAKRHLPPDVVELVMKRKDGFSLENVGGQDLLIPVGSRVLDMNGLVVLNAVGRYIWELLAEDRSLDELAAAVVEHFDVDAGRARADIEAFVADLGAKGLIAL